MDTRKLLDSWGLAGVFVVCFLSATLLPGVSEVGLGALAVCGVYRAAPLVAVASVGNWLGSVVTYATGWIGSEWLMSLLGLDESSLASVQEWIDAYGSLCGLLVWAPWVGDPLALGLGAAKAPVVATCLTMLIGKVARYAIIVGIAVKAKDIVKNKKKLTKTEDQKCTTI